MNLYKFQLSGAEMYQKVGGLLTSKHLMSFSDTLSSCMPSLSSITTDTSSNTSSSLEEGSAEFRSE